MVLAMPSTPAPAVPVRSRQSGAFDLPSVLIGVAVVAILAIGVMAAVFGVIPWAQDRAAQQDLAAVTTAQGTNYARDGSFADKDALVGAGWLGEGTPEALETKAGTEGKCYVAVATSKTGKRFVATSDRPAPQPLTSNDAWCSGTLIAPDTAAVMVSTWNTSAAECREITLPVTGLKGTVSWGDGSTDAKTTHTFDGAGETQIRIDGTFTAWGSNGWADARCLIAVDRWGMTGTSDLSYAFSEADSLRHVESIPATTTNLGFVFQNVDSAFTLGRLYTANVTTMVSAFDGAAAFNQPLEFNTSRVTSMYRMFRGASAFNSRVAFDTSGVVNMASMFWEAASFNQQVSFDTARVTSMGSMFRDAHVFNQPVPFNTSKVTEMNYMFSGTHSFDQPLNFDTANVVTLASMFSGATAFNHPVAFDTAKTTTMYDMFKLAAAFNQPVNFNTSKVTTMYQMFMGAAAFNQPVINFDTSQVTTTTSMFNGARVFDQPVNFDTSQVMSMVNMFLNAYQFNHPVRFNTSKVTDMMQMFNGAQAFNQPLNFDTSKVTNMTQMFMNARSFNQDLSEWNVTRVSPENRSSFSTGATSWTLPKPAWIL